jgi:hypothetical protein
MTETWTFPGNNDAGREGFNASGIAIFAGGLVQSFVREVIQNSLDARDSDLGPVKIDFSLLAGPKSSFPEISNLLPHIKAAQSAETNIKASTEEGISFYKRAVKSLESDSPMRVLAIHDHNTVGLDGETIDTGNEEIGGWLGLVKGSGITKKSDADSLGSFGQGAKAPFAISGLRTLFYFTRTSHDGQLVDRCQGKSILQTMTLPNGELSMATGYFGIKEKLQPLIGSDIPKWVLAERLRVTEGKGTSIFIADPYLPEGAEELWFEIKVSVIANFYYAILRGNLEVSVGDGTKLSVDTLDSAYESLDLLNTVTPSEFSEEICEGIESVQTIHEARKDETSFGRGVSKTFGIYDWFIRTGDGVQGRSVGIARKSGMLITRSAESLKQFRNGVKPFDLFICVVDSLGSEILKSFENPEHNKFQFDRIRDPEKRADYKKKYNSFAAEIRELIKDLAGYEITDSAKTNDLNDLLGGYLDEEAGDLTDEMSRRIRVGKKEVRVPVSGEGISIEITTGPGEGKTGGDGKPETGGGSNPNPDGDGDAKVEQFTGNRIVNLRVVPLAIENDGQVPLRLFVSAPEAGEFDLRLFKAGETLSEPVQFKTSKEGVEKSSAPYTFKKNERKEVTIYVEPEVADFAFEGMLSK